MTNEYAYNELTGVTAEVPSEHIDHPILGANLRRVRNGKRRGRMTDIISPEDAPATSKRRVTNVATPDKDKED